MGTEASESSITLEGLIPGGNDRDKFETGEKGGQEQRRPEFFSLVSPLDRNPTAQHQAYIHVQPHHSWTYIVDVSRAQEDCYDLTRQRTEVYYVTILFLLSSWTKLYW